jgi:glycosyltransferase involved in cell wall biosynthesis
LDDRSRESTRRGRPQLLVVPHVYAEDISVREIELAKRLTGTFDVFCLCWPDALHVDGPPTLARRLKQLRVGLEGAFAPHRTRAGASGMTLVQAPVMQAVLLHRFMGRKRSEALTRAFNRSALDRVVRAHSITHILLAAAAFTLPRIPGVRCFLDIIDWFPEDIMPAQQAAAVRTLFRQSADAADGVFAVSELLSEKLKRDCGIDAIPLPNGADLIALRSVSSDRVAALRGSLGLAGKYVIGYIGNHGSYTGVDFAVKAFEAVRGRIPNAALLIVGPAEFWRPLLESKRGEGVVWTGPVPPSEIAAYFHALDLGILAQEKSLFTELAFQIKIVEYSACRKFVISTPLQTWERLNWPNVFLTPLQVDAWVEAIVRAQQSKWQSEWDAKIEAYDWSAIADRMAALLLDSGAREEVACVS